MFGSELITEINGDAAVPEKTCDVLLNPECDRKLSRVAVSMFATVEVLQQVKDWGADLLIVHEPVLLQNADAPVSRAKAELVKSVGFPIYRNHDHAHAAQPDLIAEGDCGRSVCMVVLKRHLTMPLICFKVIRQSLHGNC